MCVREKENQIKRKIENECKNCINFVYLLLLLFFTVRSFVVPGLLFLFPVICHVLLLVPFSSVSVLFCSVLPCLLLDVLGCRLYIIYVRTLYMYLAYGIENVCWSAKRIK